MTISRVCMLSSWLSTCRNPRRTWEESESIRLRRWMPERTVSDMSKGLPSRRGRMSSRVIRTRLTGLDFDLGRAASDLGRLAWGSPDPAVYSGVDRKGKAAS